MLWSRASSHTLAKGCAAPPKAISACISSETTVTPRSAHSRASLTSVSRGHRRPPGLCGLHRMSRRVRPVSLRSRSSKSISHRPSTMRRGLNTRVRPFRSTLCRKGVVHGRLHHHLVARLSEHLHGKRQSGHDAGQETHPLLARRPAVALGYPAGGHPEVVGGQEGVAQDGGVPYAAGWHQTRSRVCGNPCPPPTWATGRPCRKWPGVGHT